MLFITLLFGRLFHFQMAMKTEEQILEYVSSLGEAVILLEGTRNLPKGKAPELTRFARILAGDCPQARFRSGNATGTDQAFAEGVASVDASRLEIVLPYTNMRRKSIPTGASVFSLENVPPSEETELAAPTLKASPKVEWLLDHWFETRKRGRLTARAVYLLRDALKVVGSPKLGLAPADCGIFYTDPASPASGGTGHTIRLCRQNGVVVLESSSDSDSLHQRETKSQ